MPAHKQQFVSASVLYNFHKVSAYISVCCLYSVSDRPCSLNKLCDMHDQETVHTQVDIMHIAICSSRFMRKTLVKANMMLLLVAYQQF